LRRLKNIKNKRPKGAFAKKLKLKNWVVLHSLAIMGKAIADVIDPAPLSRPNISLSFLSLSLPTAF
jgi:hypothetical protein